MERFVCIHGHFYQPPRENPWLESIELQDSAYPYHDWNERITAECYAPNSASRIQDRDGKIARILNNYTRISFNFGPTLLSWMESHSPETYQAILDADKESMGRFSGHGSAIAQAYNHIIMPLASSRDKRTQVIWGIRDFEHRFKRQPEGMWLPETAVDLETLDIMAEQGIRFTILSPRQATSVRRVEQGIWRDVSGGRIFPTMPYVVRLSSGREIAVFFYDEAIARSVAFEGLLRDGSAFAARLTGAFSGGWPQLVNIATDGETYGHHHRFGDMALAFALHHIESNGSARLTNYGAYLEQHPPTREVQLQENTSWSCVHGVERWRSDCGCSTGQHPGWNQAWRTPLREALDWLRDSLVPRFEVAAKQYLVDPWAARDDYIAVVLDRAQANVDRWLAAHATHSLDAREKTTVLKLMELQRNAMLMFTSCGWFFEDISGIETVQVLQYAARAVQLAQELFGDGIERDFLRILERAKSNDPEMGDGRTVYERLAKSAVVDLERVVAHYAISSLFDRSPEKLKVYSYIVQNEGEHTLEAGKTRLVMGRATVTSEITRDSETMAFGVLHFGDHNVSAGVRRPHQVADYEKATEEISRAFSVADLPETIRLLDRHFGTPYSVRSLFRDEQRRVLGRILEPTLKEIETEYRHLYDDHYPTMRFLAELGQPLPKAFTSAVEFVVNVDLRRELGKDLLDLEQVNRLLKEAKEWNVHLDSEGLGYVLTGTLERMAERLASSPTDRSLLSNLMAAVTLARSAPFDLNLWRVQNLLYRMAETLYPRASQMAREGDTAASKWIEQFIALAGHLSIRVPQSGPGGEG